MQKLAWWMPRVLVFVILFDFNQQTTSSHAVYLGLWYVNVVLEHGPDDAWEAGREGQAAPVAVVIVQVERQQGKQGQRPQHHLLSCHTGSIHCHREHSLLSHWLKVGIFFKLWQDLCFSKTFLHSDVIMSPWTFQCPERNKCIKNSHVYMRPA